MLYLASFFREVSDFEAKYSCKTVSSELGIGVSVDLQVFLVDAIGRIFMTGRVEFSKWKISAKVESAIFLMGGLLAIKFVTTVSKLSILRKGASCSNSPILKASWEGARENLFKKLCRFSSGFFLTLRVIVGCNGEVSATITIPHHKNYQSIGFFNII
jgi:hypothetical protein